MRIIGMEEHFYTAGYLQYLRSRKDYPRRRVMDDGRTEEILYTPYCQARASDPELANRLTDFGDTRLKEMDRAGIDVEVLSLAAPGVEAFESVEGIAWARETNDELSGVIAQYPARFAGMAALPVQDPPAAAAELERAVRKLGLKGANINSHVKGEYLDDRRFWPVFEMAEKLDVPVYIHPREPSEGIARLLAPYPASWAALWGFGAEVGLHMVRLMCSGLFDEFPRLKIVIGHMGEALPFWIWRMDNHWKRTPMGARLKGTPGEYLRRNFYITTSGLFYLPAFQCAHLALGADRIMFAVDYPHEANAPAVEFLRSLPIPDSDKEKISHVNAEKLLKL